MARERMDGDKMTDYARIDNLSEQVISFLLHEEEGYTVDEDGYILNADGCRIPREKVDYATYESLSQKEREFVDDFSYYRPVPGIRGIAGRSGRD